jgi:hypothetical protein
MTKDKSDRKREEIAKAEEFARKALTAVSRKRVSETKIRAVAKKVSKTMAGILEHA